MADFSALQEYGKYSHVVRTLRFQRSFAHRDVAARFYMEFNTPKRCFSRLFKETLHFSGKLSLKENAWSSEYTIYLW